MTRLMAALALGGILSTAPVLAADGGEDAAAGGELFAGAASTAETGSAEFRSIDQDVQSLKEEVLALNRDLFLLEEELLFPANSQVAFFLSLDVGEYFDLDSVSLTIDGKEVANYLYTEREADALRRGGVQRLHMENLKAGDHELVAVFTGFGPHEREYRRGATVNLEKGLGAKYVELAITDRTARQQPEFDVREWE